MIYFKNDKIQVRDIEEKDILKLFLWRIDEDTNKYDPRKFPTNSKELLADCENFCELFDNHIVQYNSNGLYRYFIIEDSNTKSIGFINIFNINKESKECEMGVIIGDENYRNKKIAYEVIMELKKYIFTQLNINRIYIETTSENKPALKLFQNLKFNKCGEYLDDCSKFIVMELKNK